MLLPSHFSKFHQNLHQLRAYKLPKLLTQLNNDSIPSCCCKVFILWQCCIGKLLEKELSVSKDQTSPKPRILSHVEQKAVRYTAIDGSRNFKRGVPNQLNGCGHKYYIKLWVWFVMFIGKMDAKPTEL